MRIAHQNLPRLRLGVVVAFTVLSALGFAYLWANSGGKIPGVTADGYRVSVPVADVNNLVYFSDIRIAGVQVGKVANVDNQGRSAMVTLDLDDPAAPLHQGATLSIRSKTLAEESYVELVDGKGPALPDGARLPASAVRESVQLDDVLHSLDPRAREAFRGTLRSLGSATKGTSQDWSRIMAGLGDLGREGHTALDAVADQSDDLRTLSARTAEVLDALDTQQGDIASLVSNGRQLTSAASEGRTDIESSMRQLPGLLDSTRRASGELATVSDALGPVAATLKDSATPLDKALRHLPGVTRDLRGLLPALDDTLDAAPATLRRVPTFGSDLRRLIPQTRVVLADVNPMLAYLKPYGRDIAAFFTNWGGQVAQGNADGHWARILSIANEQSLRNSPIDTNVGSLDKWNPYPAPGQAADPGPFTGEYPKIRREGG